MSPIINCIPNLPENWKYMKFLSLIKSVVDNRGRTAPTSETGIPLIATNCIKPEELYPVFEKIRYVDEETYDHWFRSHPEPNDIILVNKGTPGLTALVPSPVNFCFAQDMVAIRSDDKKIFPPYLFAYMRSPFFLGQVRSNIVGTLIPHFKKGDFDKILVPIPPKRLQRLIGDMYYEMSLKIHLSKRINQILERIAKIIFKEWFSGFEISNIPVRWKIDEFSNFLNINMGQSPPGVSYNEVGEGYHFFQGNKDFKFRFPSERIYTTDPKKIAEKNDVLISVRAPVGSLNIAKGTCCIGRGIAALRMKDNHGPFLYYLLKSKEGKWEYSLSSGTVIKAITKIDLESFKFIRPPEDKIIEYNKLVLSIDQKIRVNSLEIEKLNKLQELIFPRLISGLQSPEYNFWRDK